MFSYNGGFLRENIYETLFDVYFEEWKIFSHFYFILGINRPQRVHPSLSLTDGLF